MMTVRTRGKECLEQMSSKKMNQSNHQGMIILHMSGEFPLFSPPPIFSTDDERLSFVKFLSQPRSFSLNKFSGLAKDTPPTQHTHRHWLQLTTKIVCIIKTEHNVLSKSSLAIGVYIFCEKQMLLTLLS
jgi:hypothetical protein